MRRLILAILAVLALPIAAAQAATPATKIVPSPQALVDAMLVMMDYFPGYFVFTLLLPVLGIMFTRRFLSWALFSALLTADLLTLIFLSGAGSLQVNVMDRFEHPALLLAFVLLVRPSLLAILGFLISEVFSVIPRTRRIQERVARHRTLAVFFGLLGAALLSSMILLLFKYNQAAYKHGVRLAWAWAAFVGLLLIAWLVYLYRSAARRAPRDVAARRSDFALPIALVGINAIILAAIYA